MACVLYDHTSQGAWNLSHLGTISYNWSKACSQQLAAEMSKQSFKVGRGHAVVIRSAKILAMLATVQQKDLKLQGLNFRQDLTLSLQGGIVY